MKRNDLKKILVLGSGGIVIGQACEFDYSGTQAVKALRQEGYQVVLVNSNPATIMTDPEMADATYVEPLSVPFVTRVIQKERPCAILPTVGGQTALNLAMQLHEAGILERYGVQLLGASVEAIQLAEDRQRFRQAMIDIGIDVPSSQTVTEVEEALEFAQTTGYPVIVRPSFTLGGSGGGMAHHPEELRAIAEQGLRLSPVGQVLIEESVAGWKEFELEVIRDRKDNFIVVCSIENVDPMGVHTGDSITVAPALTLTDKEYQKMREWARQILHKVGVETGGSNVQFGVNPHNGRLVVIEMNPRVSRSSALASKATGFPIAKVAAKLAVGYTLDEIPNDITGTTPCSFEPVIDYVVVKIPRWDFAKFPGADSRLGPQMKSVGEVMALGRTFCEALQKGLRSLEIGLDGLSPARGDHDLLPHPERLLCVGDAFRQGQSLAQVYTATSIDPWFLDQIQQIVELEGSVLENLLQAKKLGFSDAQIARLTGLTQAQVRERRCQAGIRPHFQRVDTCAAEFEAQTPYLYSSYHATQDEAPPSDRDKVLILGSGPNRIGQGIEFDFCCVHASLALRQQRVEAIMLNCNPETVSTDFDISDRLYFEPLTLEDVLNVVEHESGRGQFLGVIVQLGGQTPLKLVSQLEAAGVPILGSGSRPIDLAEDRERFAQLVQQLGLTQPRSAMAGTLQEARKVAQQVGYPVLVRPSYVLGGRGMAIVSDDRSLDRFVEEALQVSEQRPVLIDQFLEDAVEVDVDCLCDGQQVVVAGILQHIEEAGVHSGDSACVMPPYKVSQFHLDRIRQHCQDLGLALEVKGLMNVQFAIQEDQVYVLEVNPRASRTAPFVSKAIGISLPRLATLVMLGRSLQELDFTREPVVDGFYVKEALLPFLKFPGADSLLGPEMRSTGEVMGHDQNFGWAFAKSQVSAGCPLPVGGMALFTVNDYDKGAMLKMARDLQRLGFHLMATGGTAQFFERAGLEVRSVLKVSQGSPNVVDAIRAGEVQIVFNTPLTGPDYNDGKAIRRAAIDFGIPLITTTSAATAAVSGIRALLGGEWSVRPLQRALTPA